MNMDESARTETSAENIQAPSLFNKYLIRWMSFVILRFLNNEALSLYRKIQNLNAKIV